MTLSFITHHLLWLDRMIIKYLTKSCLQVCDIFPINIDLYNLKVKMYKKCKTMLESSDLNRKLVLASEVKVVTSHWAS